jgi:hypothetical protein
MSTNNNTTTYSTFAVLFYINRQKVKKNGLCPLMGRVSINAEIAQFSAGIDLDPNLWDAKAYRMTGRSRHAAEVNHHIILAGSQSFLCIPFIRKNIYPHTERRTFAVHADPTHNRAFARFLFLTGIQVK